MRRLLVAGVLLLVACGRDAGLKLTISTAPARPDTCFEVTVSSTAGDPLGTAAVPRADGGSAFEAIINQGAFPDDVTLAVQAWVADGGCAEPRIANGLVTQRAHFVKGLTQVDAKLEQLTDDDGDLAVATTAGGADCADDDATASPFFAEDCAQSGDFDCDGFMRCADSDCAPACEGLPAKLVFTNPPLTVQRAECSNALHLEAQTASGAPTALPGGLTLSGAGVAFFSASDCSGVAPTSLPQGGLSIYLRADALGVFTLTASAPGLTSATQDLEVLSVPHVTLFSSPTPVIATQCTLQAVQLYGADGGAYVSGTPVTVSFDASGPFELFADCTSGTVVSDVTLAGVPSTVFGFSTPRAGSFTLTGSAPGFASGSVTYQVQPGPAYAVQVDAGAPLLAATCNAISVSWTDDAGNPTTPSTMAFTSDLTLFSDSACTDAGRPALSSSVTLFTSPGDEGAYAFAVDGGAYAAVTLNAVRPFPPGAVLELPLSVQTGPTPPYNGYQGYSMLVLTDAGAPLPADLSLLRAYFWGATGWAELDRLYGDAPNNQLQFWFRSQTALGDGATDTHYAFFVMEPGSLAAKDSPDNVWLFFDDFENGLGKWADGGSQWVLSTDGGFYSSNALTNLGNDAGTELTLSPLVPLSERDLSYQSVWKSPNLTAVNFAQQLRVQATDGGPTWLGHEVNKGSTWRLATYGPPSTYQNIGTINSGGPSPTIDGWSVVLVRMCGAQLDAQTPSGYLNLTVNGPFDAGTIGLRSSGSTGAPLSIDAVVVRRYACPEPTTSVLPARATP